MPPFLDPRLLRASKRMKLLTLPIICEFSGVDWGRIPPGVRAKRNTHRNCPEFFHKDYISHQFRRTRPFLANHENIKEIGTILRLDIRI